MNSGFFNDFNRSVLNDKCCVWFQTHNYTHALTYIIRFLLHYYGYNHCRDFSGTCRLYLSFYLLIKNNLCTTNLIYVIYEPTDLF